jgi:hypothetical protein
MKVICVNDRNKPDRVLSSEWIKEGEIYNVREVVRLGLQPGKFGYILEEVQLSKASFPYESYNAERFAIVTGIQELYGEQMVYAEEPELLEI